MSRVFIIYFVLMVISNYVIAQYKIEIEITEIKNNEGKIMMQFFDENHKVLTQEMKVIKDRRCVFSVKNLKPGKYAFRFYHDENLNGILEMNMFGKPTEGYGISNKATGKFGAPPFGRWLFEVMEDKKILVKPIYLY